METKVLRITDPQADHDKIEEAAEIIRNGGIVAFPTDTVYALGASMENEEAIEKLYEVKQRPKENPMNILVARDLDIHTVINLTSTSSIFMSKLIENFWPGPLTIVMDRLPVYVSSLITAGMDTVGVRQPDDPIATELIYAVDHPIVAPSANISGHPSPTTAQHVIDEFDGKIDAILVGPDCKEGIESTIIDLSKEYPIILRPGTITIDEIQDVLPKRVYQVESVPAEYSL